MLTYHIRSFTASDGFPLTVLVDNHGCPQFWPNAYAALKYRDKGRSPYTTSKELRNIGMVYLWADARQKDLDLLLTRGEFITSTEAMDLAFFLRLKSNSQKKTQDHSLAPKKIVRITKKEQIRGGFCKQASLTDHSAISNEEAANRIHSAARYLSYHLSRRLSNRQSIHPTNSDFKKNAEDAIHTLRELAPQPKGYDDEPALEGLPIEAINMISEAFSPDAPRNPFKNEFVRKRNHLLFLAYRDSGARRTEIRYLRVDDVDYASRKIHIRVSKTFSRTVSVSNTFCEHFHSFVTSCWKDIPIKSRQHGYLFTTEKGAHLASDTINLVFRTMRSKIMEMPLFLSPHVLRRSWNDRFSETIDSQPLDERISEDKEKQIRNRLMGWSATSNMSVRYAKRHIRKKADEIAERLMERMQPVFNDDQDKK